ncbi:MAG: ABC transporter substrate-binding protein [Coriobacteriia bacterium]|nr:ABC transporter substrate-binding protein [Coriobacteriia bacterium]
MAITRRNFLKCAGVAGIGAMSLSMGGVLSACSSGSSEGAKASVSGNANEVVVTMTPASEPASGFDPLFSWGCGEHVHEPLIQSTLVTTDTNLNFVNDLATDYSCSDDGLTWTFKIRDDVKFTDGKPLTARDVAFTINGINAAEVAEADLSMVKKAVAVNDTTVELHLSKPFNALLYTLAVVGIVPEHAYNSKTYGKKPIGSGRYVLEQWDQGQQVILKANPDYYGEAPKMERLIVVFMEEDASLAAAKSGQVDIAYTAATKASAMPDACELLVCKSVDSRGISLPTIAPGNKRSDGNAKLDAGNAVTQDVAIRRALNYALDRETMIANVLGGYGTPAYSVSDGMPWASDDMKVDFDLEKAKSILEEGGWKLGSDGIYEKKGTRAAFDLYYAATDSVRQALAVEFANQMKELGIEVNTKGASWDDQSAKGFCEPILWGWGSNSPVELYDLSYSDAWGNFACYENKTVDIHFDAALAKTKVEDSYGEWKAAQWDGKEGIAPQGAATWVWLANVDHLYFKRKGLTVADQKPHPHGHGWSLVNNVDRWSWEG